jgi:uncharacterized protein YpmB
MKYISVLLTVMLLLGGCTIGNRPSLSKEDAAFVALASSPLKKVEEAQSTPPGPVWWVVYGFDAGARPLAVWVSKHVEGHAYLDKGITRKEAVETVRAMGFAEVNPSPVLVNPKRPTW